MLEKYWQFERKVQKILIELCNLKEFNLFFWVAGIETVVLLLCKKHMEAGVVSFFGLLFYYIREEYIFTSLKGFF